MIFQHACTFAVIVTFWSRFYWTVDASIDCMFTKSTPQNVSAISGENVTLKWYFKIDAAKYPEAAFQLFQPSTRLLYAVIIQKKKTFPKPVLKNKPFSNRITWSGDPSRNLASFLFSNVTRDLSLRYFVLLVCGAESISADVNLHVLDASAYCNITKSTPQDVFAISGENVTLEWYFKTDVTAVFQLLQPHGRILYAVLIKRKKAIPQPVLKNTRFSNRITWSGDPSRNLASFVFSNVTRDLSLRYFVQLVCRGETISANVNLHVLVPPGKVIILQYHTWAHEISLKWSPPNDIGGSPILDYIITVTGGDKIVYEEKNVTSYERNYLMGNTTYKFCIQARNVAGKSKESCINLTTLNKEKSNCNNSEIKWYIPVITLIFGICIGMIFVYCMQSLRGRLKNRKDDSEPAASYAIPETQREQAEDDSTYQALELRNREPENKYQALKLNTRKRVNNETQIEDEASYQELANVRENKDIYQSLNPV